MHPLLSLVLFIIGYAILMISAEAFYYKRPNSALGQFCKGLTAPIFYKDDRVAENEEGMDYEQVGEEYIDKVKSIYGYGIGDLKEIKGVMYQMTPDGWKKLEE